MNKRHFLIILFLGCGVLMLYGQNGMTIESDGTVVVTIDLEVAGSSILPKVYEVSADRTFENSELSLTQTTVNVTVGTGNLTLNLSAISASNRGKIIEFIQVDDNAGDATITPNGSDTINGTPSWLLNGQWQRVRVQSDGVSDWRVLECLGTYEEYKSISDVSPGLTNDTWLKPPGHEITIGPGVWEISYEVEIYVRYSGAYTLNAFATLSTDGSTETDVESTIRNSITLTAGGTTKHYSIAPTLGRLLNKTVSSSTTISLLIKGASSSSALQVFKTKGTEVPTIIRARRIG